MAGCAMTSRKVENVEFVWSLAVLYSQTSAVSHDLDSIFNQDSGQPFHQHLKQKWFSKCENTSKPKLSATGLLAFSVIAARQGNHQLRESLQVALTIMSAKDHERYFQQIPALSQHRTMFRAYVDLCLKFVNVCDSKNGALNADTEVVVVWSSLLEPLGQMLNLLFKDHLQRTSSQWLMNIPKPDNLDIITESLKCLDDDGIYEQFYSYDFDADQRFQNGVQQILLRLAGDKQETGQQSLDLLLQAKLFYFSRFYFEIGLQGYEAWLNEKCKETFTPITDIEDTNVDEKDELAINETEKYEDQTGTIFEEEDIEENAIDSEELIHILEQEDTTLLTDEEKVKKIGDTERQQPTATGYVGGGALGGTETNVDTQLCGGASGGTELLDGASGGTELLDGATSLTLKSSLNTNFTLDPKQDGISIATAESTDGGSMYPTSFMQMLQLVEEGKDIPGVEHLVIAPTNNPPTESTMQRSAKPWKHHVM